MKNLILLGSGHAHVHVLSTLAAHPLPGVQVTLVTPYPRQLHAGMLSGFITGHHALADCAIPLAPLLEHTGIRWLSQSASALDARTRTLTLDDGSTLHYDWLSVNTDAVHDLQKMHALLPGSREYGLFLRPLDPFTSLWPRLLEQAQGRALRVAVIGAGSAGTELIMAMAHRLPGSSLTLICDAGPLAERAPLALQQRTLKALKQRRITVLTEPAVGLQAGEVLLGNGARLVCDVPVIALRGQAPLWLADSGLVRDAEGFIAVDACQRATGHPEVFAVGDVSTRADLPLVPSDMDAVRVGPTLLKNLTAAVAGMPVKPYLPPARTLDLLSCGRHEAIASWGNYSTQGRWVKWLKDRMERRFMARYRRD